LAANGLEKFGRGVDTFAAEAIGPEGNGLSEARARAGEGGRDTGSVKESGRM
jgi:hypothetical protein